MHTHWNLSAIHTLYTTTSLNSLSSLCCAQELVEINLTRVEETFSLSLSQLFNWCPPVVAIALNQNLKSKSFNYMCTWGCPGERGSGMRRSTISSSWGELKKVSLNAAEPSLSDPICAFEIESKNFKNLMFYLFKWYLWFGIVVVGWWLPAKVCETFWVVWHFNLFLQPAVLRSWRGKETFGEWRDLGGCLSERKKWRPLLEGVFCFTDVYPALFGVEDAKKLLGNFATCWTFFLSVENGIANHSCCLSSLPEGMWGWWSKVSLWRCSFACRQLPHLEW